MLYKKSKQLLEILMPCGVSDDTFSLEYSDGSTESIDRIYINSKIFEKVTHFSFNKDGEGHDEYLYILIRDSKAEVRVMKFYEALLKFIADGTIPSSCAGPIPNSFDFSVNNDFLEKLDFAY